MGEYWCQVQFGSHSDHTVRLRAVYNLASSRLRESRARWIEKARTENKTGGNWGEEGLLYPFSNLFPFPAPSTFRVPFTFGISPLSESLEQIQTRGWGEVLNLVWERSFFPKPTDNFDRFSYFVRCKYRYISSIKNVFILFLSSPIPPPSQNSVGWPSYFTANGYQHAWVFRWFRWKLGKFDWTFSSFSEAWVRNVGEPLVKDKAGQWNRCF